MRSAVLPILAPTSTRASRNTSSAHKVLDVLRRHLVELLALTTLFGAVLYLLSPRAADAGRGRRQRNAAYGKKATQLGSSALRKLYGKPRTGVGLAIERACGERHESLTPWLDALQGLEEKCADLDAKERARIVANAKRQCGSWCLWDLDREAKVGWHLSGDCFRPFASPHECDQWWYQRPGLDDLEPAADEAGSSVA